MSLCRNSRIIGAAAETWPEATCRDNVLARITEAEREGWVSELEGLEVSLAGTQDKFAQLDADQTRQGRSIDLGMPAFRDIAGCDSTPASPTV